MIWRPDPITIKFPLDLDRKIYLNRGGIFSGFIGDVFAGPSIFRLLEPAVMGQGLDDAALGGVAGDVVGLAF